MAELSKTPEGRSGRLIEMALTAFGKFFEAHDVVVKLPTEEIARAFDEGM